MDDFGTGYSSLNYFREYPFSVLKIDKTFVRDIGVDKEDSALIEAFVVMSHSLGIEVIAEGVETLAQVEFLKRIGCDYAQGYFYGAPMSFEVIQSKLASKKLVNN